MKPPSGSGQRDGLFCGAFVAGLFTGLFAVNCGPGMNSVKYLLNTSVDDGKSTLECQLRSNPQQALDDAQLAIDFINQYGQTAKHRSPPGHARPPSVNKARKALSKM